MSEIDDLMSGSAAAKYLGVTRSLVYRLHAQQRLPARMVGGHIFFSRAALDAFKAQPRPVGVNINHPKDARRPLGTVSPA